MSKTSIYLILDYFCTEYRQEEPKINLNIKSYAQITIENEFPTEEEEIIFPYIGSRGDTSK